ncbi:MAG: hypothetical protein WCO00_14280 [Rhodospirillaceae bacterium]
MAQIYAYILSRTCPSTLTDNTVPCDESGAMGRVDDEILISTIIFATKGLDGSERLCIGVRGYPWVGQPPANTSESKLVNMEFPDYQMDAIKKVYPSIEKLHKCVIMTEHGMMPRNEMSGQNVLMIDWPRRIMGGYYDVGYEYMMIGDIHSMGTSMILSSCDGIKNNWKIIISKIWWSIIYNITFVSMV